MLGPGPGRTGLWCRVADAEESAAPLGLREDAVTHWIGKAVPQRPPESLDYHQLMDEYQIALLALAVAILAVLATVWVHRREHPRQKLTIWTDGLPLVPQSTLEMGLAVLHKGQEVANPWAVTVYIENSGAADISSTSFNDGKPFILDLGAEIIEPLSQNVSIQGYNLELSIGTAPRTAVLEKSLLPKGVQLQTSFLCNGAPRPKVIQIPFVGITVDATAFGDSAKISKQRYTLLDKVLRAILVFSLFFIAFPFALMMALGFFVMAIQGTISFLTELAIR